MTASRNGCYATVDSTGKTTGWRCPSHQSPWGQNGGDNGSPEEESYGRQLSLIPALGWVEMRPFTQRYIRSLEQSQQTQQQFFLNMKS